MKTAAKRKALGQFLRFKRAQLLPHMVGLASGTRRRTAGLRREEVATLANISTAWYTYLEQGRDIQPSPEVLTNIAQALHLTDIEGKYLYALAAPASFKPQTNLTVPTALQRLLDNFGIYPAYITAHTWDILAWNQAACRLFTDFAAMPRQQRNLVTYVLTDAALRRMYTDWEGNARRLLAQFRMSFGLHADDPRFAEIISSLLYVSAEFAQWWTQHDVGSKVSGIKSLHHPRVGPLQVEYATFQSNDNPYLTLTTYTAVNPASEATLQKLACDKPL